MTNPVEVKADYRKYELIIRKNSMHVEVQTINLHFYEQVTQLVRREYHQEVLITERAQR